MARTNEATNSNIPLPPDHEGWRHYGDGIAGRIATARIQGYDPVGLGYVDLQVDSNGVLQTAGGGGSGGAVTQGTVPWVVSNAGTFAVQATVASLPLPTGAATEATLAALSAKITNPLPVSAASLPLPAGAATSALQTTISGQLPATLGQKAMAASLAVVLASDQSALTVASHAVTNAGTFAVQATLAAETTKVIGTVNQGTSPWVVAATLSAETTKVIGVVRTADGSGNLLTSTASALDINIKSGNLTTLPVTNAGTFAVQAAAPTLTKGTQGANGYSVQELRDAGRNTRIFMLDAITAAPLVEAVQTVVQWYGNAAVAGTTQPAVVPAGKTLRLTGYKIQYQSLATVGYAVVRIRVNTAGLGVLASPLVASFEAGSGSGATTVAMTGGVTTETGTFEEGLEIPAASGLAFSMAGYGPTGTLTLEGGTRFEVYGYEY